MKATFAVAVLLGLVAYSPSASAVEIRRHHHHRDMPYSHQYVQQRDAEDQDLSEVDAREAAAEAESERLEKREKVIRRGELAQERRDYYEGEENTPDDEFIQESEMIYEEEEESGDESEYNRERGDEAVADSSDEDDEEQEHENVQVESEDEEDEEEPAQSAAQVDRIPERTYFFAGDTNVTPQGKEYERQYPAGFDEDSPNKFVHHILKEYALEEKDKTGNPTGNFFMNKKWTQVASREVLQKFKKLDGNDLEKYMNQYFGRTWEHFDVTDSNMLDALDMPAFMKYLCSDQSLDLDKL